MFLHASNQTVSVPAQILAVLGPLLRDAQHGLFQVRSIAGDSRRSVPLSVPTGRFNFVAMSNQHCHVVVRLVFGVDRYGGYIVRYACYVKRLRLLYGERSATTSLNVYP